MKNVLLALIVFSLVGCSGMSKEGVKFREYLKHPRMLIKDPHFAEYKEKRDAIESMYLNKGIDYVEYTNQMEELDGRYVQEVEERNAKIQE
ncbi:MAG: hypothetical protein ACI9F2_000065 [Lysobacterales bacterium]|jgi:hypothetical protein